MQWTLGKRFVSEDEIIKDQGLFLDYDEIARKGAMTAEEKNISKSIQKSPLQIRLTNCFVIWRPLGSKCHPIVKQIR